MKDHVMSFPVQLAAPAPHGLYMGLRPPAPSDIRYWVAMAAASICGANLGDAVAGAFPDGTLGSLPWLAATFGLLLGAGRLLPSETALPYWLLVLVICAAATNLANCVQSLPTLGWPPAALSAGLLLAAGLVLSARKARVGRARAVVQANPLYWSCMLAAGTAGTILADGLARLIQPITVGNPIACGITTAAVGVAFGFRLSIGPAAFYWVAVVVLRAWGTDVGDAASFLLTRPVSILASAAALLTAARPWAVADGAGART